MKLSSIKLLLLFLLFGRMIIVIDINQLSLCERVVNYFVVRTIRKNRRTKYSVTFIFINEQATWNYSHHSPETILFCFIMWYN